MSGKVITIMALACVCTAIVMPADLLAGMTNSAFGGDALAKQSGEIQKFIFGPGMRMIGVMGAAYGVIKAIMADWGALIKYGGISLGILAVPSFIDGVFGVSTMLLP